MTITTNAHIKGKVDRETNLDIFEQKDYFYILVLN